MTLQPKKPLNAPVSQQKINLADTETVKCEKCNNSLFIQSYILKKISAIISPSGKEELITVPVFSCGSCGEIEKTMLSMLEK